MMRREAAPQQHGNDQREHDHFLEPARPERRERFEQADEQCARRGERIADEPADDRADEALEADEEPGIVIDRRDGADQHAGERARAAPRA